MLIVFNILDIKHFKLCYFKTFTPKILGQIYIGGRLNKIAYIKSTFITLYILKYILFFDENTQMNTEGIRQRFQTYVYIIVLFSFIVL